MQKRIDEIEQLFKEHHKTLCNVANNIINDRDASQDIVQDVFIKLWKIRDKIPFSGSVRSYLIRATVNTSLNYIEKHKRSQLVENEQLEMNSFTGQLVDDELDGKELQRKIKEALDKLPPKCKAIFVLSRYEGLKYKQIAEHLEISVKTVENQMGIALTRLKKDLLPYLKRTLTLVLALILREIFNFL